MISSALALAITNIMDYFQRHLKMAINIMLSLSSLMFIWILLLDNNMLNFYKEELYTAIILGVSVCWSTSALFLELTSEMAFPVSEAIVGGYLIFFSNVVGSVFYMLQFIPNMGTCNRQFFKNMFRHNKLIFYFI